MIEKKDAVENLEPILERAKTRGVDMVQWGPADYSVSMGDPNYFTVSPFIVRNVIRKCLEHQIAPRIEIGEVDQAKRYIDLGVRHFCIGWDRFILQAGLMKLGMVTVDELSRHFCDYYLRNKNNRSEINR